MKAVIIGHITLDEIEAGGKKRLSLGGPPLYMGLFLQRLGVKVGLLTRFGTDLGDERINWILRSGLEFRGDPLSLQPTTRFRIVVRKEGRELYLLRRCEDIEGEVPKADLLLVNPVIGEVSVGLNMRPTFLYLDPQGFLRSVKGKKVHMKPSTKPFTFRPDAMKVDPKELYLLTGVKDISKGVKNLHERGVKEVLLTLEDKGTYLSLGKMGYFIPPRKVEVADGVGMGDLLGAGYSYGRIVGGPAYGLALGYAAATLCADRPALEKIPTREEVLSAAKKYMKRMVKTDLEGLGE